jgi:hypothetical protein
MKSYLGWVHIGPRGSARTTALANAARNIGATLVGASIEQAHMLQARHGVPAISVDRNVRGTRGPYIFDHYTVERLILDYESELDRVRRELEKAQDKLRQIAALATQ